MTSGTVQSSFRSESGNNASMDLQEMKFHVLPSTDKTAVRRIANSSPAIVWEYNENGVWKPYDSDASDFLNRCNDVGINQTRIYSQRGSAVIEYEIDLAR